MLAWLIRQTRRIDVTTDPRSGKKSSGGSQRSAQLRKIPPKVGGELESAPIPPASSAPVFNEVRHHSFSSNHLMTAILGSLWPST